MEEKKITELFIVKYDNGDYYGIENIYIKYDNGYAAIESYSEEKHGEATASFLGELTGIEITTKEDVKNAIDKAIKEHGDVFGVYEKELNKKEIEELDAKFKKLHDEWIEKNPFPVGFDVPEKDKPIEEKDNKVLKRVAYGTLAGVTLLGGLAILNRCSREDEETKEEQDTVALTKEQKAFFDSCTNFAGTFNGLTAKEGNFKLEADKDVELKMSFAEAVALNVSINDYSSEEIYELFGVLGLDAENLTQLRNSAYEKLTTYYMNATEVSGIADMIRDEDAKAFYLSQEQAIIAFNANPSQELADNFINTTMHNYLNVKDGGSVEMKESLVVGEGSSAMAKAGYMASTTVQGYMLANRNVDDYLKASDNGLSLTSLKTEKDGVATKVGVMDIINDANLCNDLNESIEQLISDYTDKVTTLTTYEQSILLSGLSEKAADIVREKGFGEAALQEAAGLSSADSTVVNNYLGNMEAYQAKGAVVQKYIEESNAKVSDTKQTDVAFLINNRFRTVEKEEVKVPVVEEESTVVEETTKEEKVEYEDLTKEEKEEVDEKVEEMQKKEYEGNAIAEGAKEASEYATTEGKYTYTGEKLVDANGNDVTSLLAESDLYNIAYMVAAYSDSEISVKDVAIQAARAKDVKEFEEKLARLGVSNSKDLVAKYSVSWNSTMEDLLKDATTKGNEEEQRVAREQEELRKAIEEANKQLNEGNQTVGEGVMDKAEDEIPGIKYEDSDEKKEETYDPELDPDYNSGGIDFSAYFQQSVIPETDGYYDEAADLSDVANQKSKK